MPEAIGQIDTQAEEAEKKDKFPELSNDQYRKIGQKLDEAEKEGVICPKDKGKVYAKLENLPPQEKEKAEQHLDDYLKSKKKHLDDYTKKVEDAVFSGLISADDAKKLLEEHKEKLGDDRKEDEERVLPRFLEKKKLEKKKYEDLIKDSPHYSKDGALNKEGKKLMEPYKKLGERDKTLEKKRLIRKMNTMDMSLDICKTYYDSARQLFEGGQYDASRMLMKRNIRICKRNPESAQLREYLEWAQGDMKNLEYEKEKADEIRESREDRDDCIKSGDRDNALDSSQDLVEKTRRNLQYTYSTKTKTESPRSTKWITAFMKKDEAEAGKTHSSLKTVYQKLEFEDKKEEERADTETQTIDSELAKDKVSQTYIKGATDMSKKSDEDPEAEQEALGHDEEEIIQHDRVHNLSEEQREEAVIEIDEDKHGRLQEKQARDILQSDTQIELKKKDRELNTRDEIETELNKRILDQEEKLITRLEKEGKISGDTLAREHQRIKVLKGGKNLGREIMKEADRRENIVVSGREESSAKNVKKVLDSTREQEGGKIINPDEARRKASKKRKSDMIKKIAA